MKDSVRRAKAYFRGLNVRVMARQHSTQANRLKLSCKVIVTPQAEDLQHAIMLHDRIVSDGWQTKYVGRIKPEYRKSAHHPDHWQKISRAIYYQ